MKASEMLSGETPTQIMARKFKKFMNFMKQVLFLIMLILTFFVSEKLSVVIDTMSIETLKQIINVVLAVTVVVLALYKKNK
jgi:ABC-type transport system involved in cytochrome c biogenesis permease subunit